MLDRIKTMRLAIKLIQYALRNEREMPQIDAYYQIPKNLDSILSFQQYWTDLDSEIDMFDPISTCVRFCMRMHALWNMCTRAYFSMCKNTGNSRT